MVRKFHPGVYALENTFQVVGHSAKVEYLA